MRPRFIITTSPKRFDPVCRIKGKASHFEISPHERLTNPHLVSIAAHQQRIVFDTSEAVIGYEVDMGDWINRPNAMQEHRHIR